MKTLNTLLVGLVVLTLSIGQAYAASNEKGKGADNGKGKGVEQNQGNHGQGNKGQVQANQVRNIQASTQASEPETRKHVIEKGKSQAALRANQLERESRGRSAEHKKIKGAKIQGNDLFKAFGKSRWSYHPNDERGQGNMGKVDMRDPFGFDKDSGREKSERGRAIHEEEPLLDLAEMLTLDFTMPDYIVFRLQQTLEQAIQAGQNPSYIEFLQGLIIHFTENPYPYNWLKNPTETISYTLTLPDGFAGTTLLVTTTLTSINDFFDVLSGPDGIRYDAGQVVMEQIEEVVLGADNTLSLSYDALIGLAGWGELYTDLSVTVTEPESGQSHTITYDRQVVLWRCPYGKVSDKRTGESIVGAKVTVHYEGGSIVALDKASNPTASNPQTTDATGRYGFKLLINRKYYLTATCPGYKDYKSEVFTEKWHVLREDIVLRPIEEELALKVE